MQRCSEFIATCGWSRTTRRGLSAVELIVLIAVLAVLVSLALPAIQQLREVARAAHCRSNLAQIGVGLASYHDTYGTLPPAAIWKPGPLSSLALHATKRIDVVTYDNWALDLLPYLDHEELAQQWQRELPIAHDKNERVRTTSLPLFNCPADNFNRSDNPYQFTPEFSSKPPHQFARGNYGMNAGTNSARTDPGSTTAPQGEHFALAINEEAGEFRLLGNGVGGINVALSYDDFQNGTGTLVAVEELRAGIHAIDGRGVWAFGQIGGSLTSAHGINGDAFAPNHQWPRADDIQGCGELHRRIGRQTLIDARMPCVNYVDQNQQATARSQHAGGVQALYVDGHVSWIADDIDPGLWHVLHSRETPASALPESLDVLLARTNELRDAPAATHRPISSDAPAMLTNSLGMAFVKIPSGEFDMGLADEHFPDPPPEAPQHRVQINRAFYLGQHEVTQQQFQQVIGRNPSFHIPRQDGDPPALDFPVEQVTWDDAAEFCVKLSAEPAEFAAGRQYRLPTEAEWEFACRGGSEQPYAIAERRANNDQSGEAAGIQPALPVGRVGRYPANPYGLKDMRGNVWEWCSDWFDRDYYARSPGIDPQGPATGYLKVLRGSDWIFVGERCLINYPIMPPWKSSPFVGFRVVCNVIKPMGQPVR